MSLSLAVSLTNFANVNNPVPENHRRLLKKFCQNITSKSSEANLASLHLREGCQNFSWEDTAMGVNVFFRNK
jgi:hypothetical protein